MSRYIDDLIRRSDAIKAVENVSENYTKEGDREWHPHIDFITQALVQVPHIDTVRCKECEYIRIYEDETSFYYCALECRPNRQWSVDETDYCSWGERKKR